jgi:hypothetical protein
MKNERGSFNPKAVIPSSKKREKANMGRPCCGGSCIGGNCKGIPEIKAKLK